MIVLQVFYLRLFHNANVLVRAVAVPDNTEFILKKAGFRAAVDIPNGMILMQLPIFSSISSSLV